MKFSYTTQNAGYKANLLPKLFGAEASDKWSVRNDAHMSELIASMPELPELPTDPKQENAYFELCEAADRQAQTIVQEAFVRRFGKRMTAQYAGKTLTGETFPTGAEIIYWSNSVDKAIVLA
jgi:hypothetical protein